MINFLSSSVATAATTSASFDGDENSERKEKELIMKLASFWPQRPQVIRLITNYEEPTTDKILIHFFHFIIL